MPGYPGFQLQSGINQQMKHILIADDHTIIRDGLKAMLQLSDRSIRIVGEAANGKALLQLLNTMQGTPPVDLVLMDIDMPEMDGLTATRHIRKHFPEIKVIILSMLEDERFVTQAFQAGASGYLLKSVGYAELARAVEVVAEGGQYITAEITLNLLSKQPLATPQTAGPAEGQTAVAEVSTQAPSRESNLTRRELEVLQLIAQGYTNAEIADRLFTSKRTVENHRQSLLEKTGSKNTALLIRYAIAHHLIDNA